MADRKLPHFNSEEEEARWWFDHRDEVAKDLLQAVREGTAGPGVVRRLEQRQDEKARQAAAPQLPSGHGVAEAS